MDNIVEPGMSQTTLWRMRIADRIPKAKITHSEYVILIAFPRQQWLHERASLLLYAYIQDVTGGKDQTSGGCSLC